MPRSHIAAVAACIVAASSATAIAGGQIGVRLDAGVPDGLNGSLVVRPTPRLRLHAGGGYNLIAPQIHAGVSLSAFPFAFTPAIAVEAGHAFSGDANQLAGQISGRPSDQSALEDVSFSYAAARAGFELGYDRVTVFVHAGMSLVRGEARGISDSFQPEMEQTNDPSIRVSDDTAHFQIIAPSAKAGLVLYF